MVTTRFDIENFNTNFTLWKIKMRGILIQSKLKKILVGEK